MTKKEAIEKFKNMFWEDEFKEMEKDEVLHEVWDEYTNQLELDGYITGKQNVMWKNPY